MRTESAGKKSGSAVVIASGRGALPPPGSPAGTQRLVPPFPSLSATGWAHQGVSGGGRAPCAPAGREARSRRRRPQAALKLCMGVWAGVRACHSRSVSTHTCALRGCVAWKNAAGSKEDVATGCNAEHEQVNRHPEHQRERPEGQKDTPKNRREHFGLSPCLPGPLPRPEHVEGSRARAAAGGGHRRPGGRALGAGLPGAYTSLHC